MPFGALLMKTAPADYLGPVTASRSSIGSIANALGMAGTTVIISRLTRGDLLAHLTQAGAPPVSTGQAIDVDRKSTRLNSSHVSESRMPSSA